MKEKLIEELKKVDIEQFNDFLSNILENASTKDLGPWRSGQYVFNTMRQVYPDIADSIRGTALDMFHIDEHILDFVKVIDDYINSIQNDR